MQNEVERREKRFPFHWPVAIVFEESAGQSTYHGITQDLSLHGCCILTEHNVYSSQQVTVLVSIPTDHPGGPRRVVEARARMVYTVLASGQHKFRCGIQFLRFKDKGLATLRQAIEKRSSAAEV
ncbi:MAG: PilZ domain-containing protein [Rhodocyclales bacterium]|nr:PilZ domain-containing protein [Rhodocyclales bacterium]